MGGPPASLHHLVSPVRLKTVIAAPTLERKHGAGTGGAGGGGVGGGVPVTHGGVTTARQPGGPAGPRFCTFE